MMNIIGIYQNGFKEKFFLVNNEKIVGFFIINLQIFFFLNKYYMYIKYVNYKYNDFNIILVIFIIYR